MNECYDDGDEIRLSRYYEFVVDSTVVLRLALIDK